MELTDTQTRTRRRHYTALSIAVAR